MIVVDCSVLIAGLLPDEVERQAQWIYHLRLHASNFSIPKIAGISVNDAIS